MQRTRYGAWATSWTVAAVMIGGLASPARADGDDKPRAKLLDGKAMQVGNGIEVGVITQGGYTEYGSDNLGLTPAVQGLVLRDRNGITARMAIGLIVAVAGAMAQSGPKSVESKSYRSGDYIITETKTTYYSEAEKAEMAKATSDSIDGLFSAPYSDFELHLFSRDRFGYGDASGYKLNMMVGSGDSIAFETGLGFGKVTSTVDAGGVPTNLTYKYFGMPFRASMVAGPVRLALTYEWNWLKYGIEDSERQLIMNADGVGASSQTTSHPWHLDASTLLFKRLTLTGGVTTQTLERHKLGYFASAGIFF